jgi:hypothetical protein
LFTDFAHDVVGESRPMTAGPHLNLGAIFTRVLPSLSGGYFP